MRIVALASAAHEFRNPLNAIVSSLDLLEDQIPHIVKDNQYFLTTKNCTNLMLFLVKDILDLSQLESKSFNVNISKVKVFEMLMECVKILEFKAL